MHCAWPYDHFIITLGMNPFYLVTKPSCWFYKWHDVNGRAWPYMGALVSSHFAFGAHANIFPLGCGSPLYSIAMSLLKSPILLLIFLLAFVPRTPLCQVVIALSWVLPASLSLMPDSLTLIISHIARACLMSSQVEPFYISFASWYPIFYWEGTFPRVLLSYTCVLALSIGMFHFLELVCFSPWHSSPPSL